VSIDTFENETNLRNFIISKLRSYCYSENDDDEEKPASESTNDLINRLLEIGEERTSTQRGWGFYSCIQVDNIVDCWGMKLRTPLL
jgi:hypothetical protein